MYLKLYEFILVILKGLRNYIFLHYIIKSVSKNDKQTPSINNLRKKQIQNG